MAVTQEEIIVEFVRLAGGSHVCFRSPGGNEWTKVIGPSFGRNDKRKSHVCIQYKFDAVTITVALANQLANTPITSRPRRPPGHYRRFTQEIDLAAVSCSANDLVQQLIAAARSIGGW